MHLLGLILVIVGAWIVASLVLGLVLARHTHRGYRRRLGAARRLVMLRVPARRSPSDAKAEQSSRRGARTTV
ncbi:hypothetical protein [Streptomyces sp. NPDC007088]|uniref:hypothetical protein n=1 Tax=Streptomyces sp. NPDC007088 TaxID=3364773 RepID=UPI0036C62867